MFKKIPKQYTGDEPATEKQLDFCLEIATTLELELPAEEIKDGVVADPMDSFTFADADNFIKEHLQQYNVVNNRKLREANHMMHSLFGDCSNGTIPGEHYLHQGGMT